MKRGTLILIIVVAAGSLFLTAYTRWRLNAREAALLDQLNQQASLLAQLTDRQRILSEMATNRSALYESAKRDLLGLRAEVSGLRRAAINPAELKAAVEKLEEEIAAQKQQSTPLPDPEKVRAYWSTNQLAFAGRADQRAALQTALWALTRAEAQTLDSVFTPTAAEQFINQNHKPDPLYRQSNLIRLADSLRSATGFYLVSDDLSPRIRGFNPEIHLFKVYFEGEGGSRGLGFRKIGAEWRFEGIYLLGGTDQQPTYEMNLWP